MSNVSITGCTISGNGTPVIIVDDNYTGIKGSISIGDVSLEEEDFIFIKGFNSLMKKVVIEELLSKIERLEEKVKMLEEQNNA